MMRVGWFGFNPWMVMSTPPPPSPPPGEREFEVEGIPRVCFCFVQGSVADIILGRVEDEQWVGVPTRAEPSSVTQGPAL